MERILRDKGYHKYNSKENPTSQVFVINAEESNIKYIAKDNEFLNNLFRELIENYDFDVDNAAIYYIFDRDSQSNTDTKFIETLIDELGNARDNNGYNRQGMLLLSYPSIEAFTLSNFEKNSFEKKFKLGKDIKKYFHDNGYNQQHISDKTLLDATKELMVACEKMNVLELNVDEFQVCNKKIYNYEEYEYFESELYRILSLLCISFIDLGLLEIE